MSSVQVLNIIAKLQRSKIKICFELLFCYLHHFLYALPSNYNGNQYIYLKHFITIVVISDPIFYYFRKVES